MQLSIVKGGPYNMDLESLQCSSMSTTMSDNKQRQASIERNTNETQISVSVNLDGTGKLTCDTGLPFLDHMLDQIA